MFKTILNLGLTGILIMIGLLLAVSVWTERSLEFVLSALKGSPINIPYWLSVIITLIFNTVAVVFNIIVELIRIFIK